MRSFASYHRVDLLLKTRTLITSLLEHTHARLCMRRSASIYVRASCTRTLTRARDHTQAP